MVFAFIPPLVCMLDAGPDWNLWYSRSGACVPVKMCDSCM